MPSREEIRERLQTDSITIGSSRTALTATVSSRKIRNIVLIRLHGDGVASRTVNIEKLEKDTVTYTMKFNTVPVAPADVRDIPNDWDIEKPIIVAEEGTRPYGTVNAGTGVTATIVYWDNDI